MGVSPTSSLGTLFSRTFSQGRGEICKCKSCRRQWLNAGQRCLLSLEQLQALAPGRFSAQHFIPSLPSISLGSLEIRKSLSQLLTQLTLCKATIRAVGPKVRFPPGLSSSRAEFPEPLQQLVLFQIKSGQR